MFRSLSLPSVVSCSLWALICLSAKAQITSPSPILTSITPLGGKPGTQIELTLRGSDLDAPQAILIGKHRLPISAISKAVVTLPTDLPTGLHDLRFIGRFGVSNPRVFEAAPQASLQSTGKNTKRETAQAIELDTAIEGNFKTADSLWFRFDAIRDKVIHATFDGHRHDTRTELVAAILDAKGREIARLKNSHLRFTVPADGSYWLRLNELMHRVGDDYAFRLTLSTAPEEITPLNKISNVSIPSTTKSTFTTTPHTFDLPLKAAQSCVIQVLSHQLGHATDPHFVIETLKADGSTTALAEAADAPAITPAPGIRLDHRDPIYAYTAKADTTLRITLSDNFATTLPFELRVTQESPTRLVALNARLPKAANAKTVDLGTASVPRGGILALEVAALNRTSLSQAIEFKKEPLADGLSCLGGYIGKGQSLGYIAFQASATAPANAMVLKDITESANASFVVADSTKDSVLIRHGGPPAIGVSTLDTPALIQTTNDDIITAVVDAKVDIPLKISRHAEFSDALKLTVHGLGDPAKAPTADIAAKATTGKLTLDLKALKLTAGEYGLILQGPAKMKINRMAEELAAAQKKAKTASEALTQAKADKSPKAAELVKTAEKAKTDADKALKDITAKAVAKEVTFMVCSNPIRLHVTTPAKP